MAAFTGQLRSNEIFGALFNMIISQEVFADNIKGTYASLVDKARVDGGLYGDTKLFYSTDVLESAVWGNDAEASNLLALHRPDAPECQAIVIDQFRQISLTIDDYLSKRAWGTEGAFIQFNSVMVGWIRDTKRVYESVYYNTYIGTARSSANVSSVEVDLTNGLSGLSGVEKEQMEAMLVAQALANLLTDMRDISRDYNDYKQLRSYDEGEIRVIWNAKHVNKIRKVDLPTVFHKDGLVDKFDEDILPARYFGTVITSNNIASYSASTPTTGKPIDSDDGAYTPGTNNANGCVRSLIETTVTVSAVAYHVFPGDEIPVGATVVASGNFEPGEVYIEDADVIAKVCIKLPPLMSAFEVGTSFFNAKSLTENRYLTWGFNTLKYLKAYPFITIDAK